MRTIITTGAKYPQGNPLIAINFQTGAFTLRSFIAGQGSVEQSGTGLRVYDASGKVRVKIGKLT